MKLLLVTAYIPTESNYRGISALEYHLLKHRPQDVNVTIICYNENRCSQEMIEQSEKELGVKIRILEESKIERICQHYHILGRVLSYMLPHNIKVYSYNSNTLATVIQQEHPDRIWLYPFFYIDIAKKFPDIPFVLTGCDCNSLFYSRWIKMAGNSISKFKYIKLKYVYNQLKRTERSYGGKNVRVHFVGKKDVEFYQEHTRRNNAYYVPHPHYGVKDKDIHFSDGKLKVLLAGNNDFYMHKDAVHVLSSLVNDNICDKVKITFLGMGWELAVHRLQSVGYECELLSWVEDYVSEIIKYDIQMTPISLGTGTKGKVLDAIANGLLCIGSAYALENIMVKNMYSCVLYNIPSEVPSILSDIYCNKQKYERMAFIGREQVRKYHNPEFCANMFYKIIR